MEIDSMYSVDIRYDKELYGVFSDSVQKYRDAVDFFIRVCMERWEDVLSSGTRSTERMKYVESVTHMTEKGSSDLYGFDRRFPKFPSYLRRSAIVTAIGKVSSYKSHVSTWEESGKKGQAPGFPRAGYAYPCLYRSVCYQRDGIYDAQVKVFIRGTWDWAHIRLRKTDVDYIARHCADRKECAPMLQKHGRRWSLDFCYQSYVSLNSTCIHEQTAVAVDLGVNRACVCSVMRADGAVLGRRFLSLPREYDCLERRTGHIRKAQMHGSRRVRSLWRLANYANKDISAKTARFIMDVASEFKADVIVFEHLSFHGKKRGSKKMRLHLWKCREVQKMVMHKAHLLGMHVSTVNACGTSRLAFDGSGEVKRGRESQKTGGNYSLCEFTTGKVYDCDLNASYNIGARYFVREILKSLPVTEGQDIAAKVPGCLKRSTCTLSTLISLQKALCAPAQGDARGDRMGGQAEARVG